MPLPDHDRLGAAVLRAAAAVVGLLEHSAVAARWDEAPVLDDMTVGALAGHLAQMVGGLAAWLAAAEPDPGTVERRSLADVYGRSARLEGPGAEPARTIARWAAQAAAPGPQVVAAQARTDLARLPDLLAGTAPGRLVPSAVVPGAALSLEDYLATRCVEYVVHADDLAVSAGLAPPEPDPEAAAVAVAVLVGLCRARAGDTAVLRALAGRRGADPDALRAL